MLQTLVAYNKHVSNNQNLYISALKSKTPIVVVTGPAGSGKTFYACKEAVSHMINGSIDNLIITRPTKTVDENHGYLPGDINKKLAPWVRPIHDSIDKSIPDKKAREKFRKKVEIAPLAYMRGRTFDNSWIIADEMQNATANQTKMMLTRIGYNSKLILTGDINQSDILNDGLSDLINRMQVYSQPLEFISHVKLTGEDIVRHEAIKEILDMYLETSN